MTIALTPEIESALAAQSRRRGMTPDELRRMRELMAQYADTPMDLADASLVAAAESLGLRQVFTLDGDFYIYRLADGSVPEIIG